MRYRLHTVSSVAWDAMLDAIHQAKQTIFWECYILLDDTPTHNFFQALAERARAGVRVKIIADAFGSFWLSRRTIMTLQEAGVEILFFNHLIPWWNIRRFRHWWLCRNHKKILIVDGQVGFLGGVNVARRFAAWLDVHVEVTGTIVRSLIRSFARSYRRCGGRDPIVIRYLHRHDRLLRRTRLIEHLPFGKEARLRRYYKQHITHAKKEIIIATPYFVPHGWLFKILRAALRRGVRVEVLLPQQTDSALMTYANTVFAEIVSEQESNINFYFTSAMVHAKILLVDNREGLIGSNNIDAQSFDFNMETGLAFQNRRMLNDVRAIVEEWKKTARPLPLFSVTPSWHRKLIRVAFWMIQPIL